ncbi:MAG: 50S ribosomal protein L9 [Myxococcota bacterium]|nr:50S ribosomal protein L9 [Myxococcota bacterium]
MATHVQVILREDVDKLGKAGELVRVRPGYARNFLLPRGLAAPATEGQVRRIEHERQAALARAARLRAEAEAAVRALEGIVVRVVRPAGEEGKLFGAVTAADVARALAELGHAVDRKRLELPAQGIRSVGEHEVLARLGGGMSARFRVHVEAQA